MERSKLEEKIRYYENQRVLAIERGSDSMELRMIENIIESLLKRLDNK